MSGQEREALTIETADSLGTVAEDIGAVIERWVGGGQDEELVALAAIVEVMRTLDGPRVHARILRWLNERYGEQ